MVDIQAELFSKITTALREKFPGISVGDEEINAPSSFPYVSIAEQDNYSVAEHMDTSSRDMATVMYEVNVYSNRAASKKQECRKIINFIDNALRAMNFTRLSMTPVPNGTIYRMTGRYRAETDGENLFRR